MRSGFLMIGRMLSFTNSIQRCTILRNRLLTDPSKADVREIYFAIHHILKSRGHFLTSGYAKDFNTNKVALNEIFPALQDAYAQVYPDLDITFDENKVNEFKTVLLNEKATPSDTQRALVNLLLAEDGDKDILKQQKQVLTEFAKAGGRTENEAQCGARDRS